MENYCGATIFLPGITAGTLVCRTPPTKQRLRASARASVSRFANSVARSVSRNRPPFSPGSRPARIATQPCRSRARSSPVSSPAHRRRLYRWPSTPTCACDLTSVDADCTGHSSTTTLLLTCRRRRKDDVPRRPATAAEGLEGRYNSGGDVVASEVILVASIPASSSPQSCRVDLRTSGGRGTTLLCHGYGRLVGSSWSQ